MYWNILEPLVFQRKWALEATDLTQDDTAKISSELLLPTQLPAGKINNAHIQRVDVHFMKFQGVDLQVETEFIQHIQCN